MAKIFLTAVNSSSLGSTANVLWDFVLIFYENSSFIGHVIFSVSGPKGHALYGLTINDDYQ